MCGINGILALRNVPQIQERLNRMNISLLHRGPDAGQIKVVDNKIGFAHRRLAIIDLDVRAEQPMVSNNGDTIIVFNGEIFNFKEIKKSLEINYTFKTESDTEVIIAAFELKGIDWLCENLNGMFAFVIYNASEQVIYLVKDRFGIKPLFYYLDDEILVFSSEIKGILNSGLVEAKLNKLAIDDYLGHRYVREPFTFFQNIKQVNAASYLKIDFNLSIKEKKYWQLPALNFESNYDEADIINRTKDQVVEAVDRWSLSDVKLGAYLSGGLDSSLTTAILSNFSNNRLDTYTIGFKEDGFNEFEYAQIVSDQYKTNHHQFLINADNYWEEWKELISYKDGPLAVPNEIPLAIMTSYLSKNITVVVSGEGADELFGGYGKIYRLPFDYENHKVLQKETFYQNFVNSYEYVPRKLRDNFLAETNNYRKHFDEEIQNDFAKVNNEEAVFRYFHNYHIKGLLNRVDMTSMRSSIEARPPFMDHKLVEFVYNEVPYDLKLKWNNLEAENKAKSILSSAYSEILDTPKYILKKVGESFLPDEIIYRKKMGFPVPLTNWLPDLLIKSNNILKEATWLNKNSIDYLQKEIENTNSERAGQMLWMFLNIEIFIQLYFNKNWKW